jgi:hypothetical protein
MDGARRDPGALERGCWQAVRARGRVVRMERGPVGDAGIVVVRERGLRRVAQAEHGKPAVARDEADSEHAGAVVGPSVQGIHGVHRPGPLLPICCASFSTPWTSWTSWTTRAREPARNAGEHAVS